MSTHQARRFLSLPANRPQCKGGQKNGKGSYAYYSHRFCDFPWEIEWIVLPEAFCLVASALKQAKFVLHGLEVHARVMRRNIDLTGALVMSEALMMGLTSYIGREYAHDL